MKKTKQIGWNTCFIIAICIVILPNIVRADLKEILLSFQPYITLQEEYNSNLDLTATNRKEDYITSIYVGLKLTPLLKAAVTGELQKVPTTLDRKYGIDLNFNAGFQFYNKETDNNYISLNGELNGWYSFTPNLAFRVREYLNRSDEARETDYAAGSLPNQYLLATQRGREVYFRNVFEPSLEYRFGRENLISGGYRNNLYKNQSRTSEDSMENAINTRLIYWFNVRNGVSFEYDFTLGNFEDSPNEVGHTATGRYTYRFNPRTSIFGEYTQEWRNFDKPSFGEIRSSIDYMVYRPSIGIEHAFSPTFSGMAQFGYYWQTPEKGPTNDGPVLEVSLSKRAGKTTYTVSSEVGYTEDYYTSENLGFTEYARVIGVISHQLLQRMTIGLFGSYEWAKYPGGVIENKTSKDQIWEIGGNSTYQILKWLTVSLDGSYRENRSNIENSDYSEYRGIFRITATY